MLPKTQIKNKNTKKTIKSIKQKKTLKTLIPKTTTKHANRYCRSQALEKCEWLKNYLFFLRVIDISKH